MNRKGLITIGGFGLTVLATAGWRNRSVLAAGKGQLLGGRVQGDETGAAASCVLSPEQTQGPYYISKEKFRSNIAERKPGVPLTLRLSIQDASTCAPLKGAVVDIWHCDAGGIYSGFESASTGGPGGNSGPTDHDTFLRGIQRTDAHGLCRFQTVYPGWYRGRTVHIHVLVHVGGAIVHTGQLYFSDTLTDQVYLRSPYRAHGSRDTRNSNDGIYASGGAQSTLAMQRLSTGGYVGSITLGVRRA